MATRHSPQESTPAEGRPALPATVNASRDRDGRLVYEIERAGRRGFVLVLAFLAAAVVASLSIVTALRTRAVDDIGIALSLTSLALVLWAAFLTVDRTRVRVVSGEVVVHSNNDVLRFELHDAQVSVTETGRRTSKKWRAHLVGRGGRTTTLRRSQVDPEGFAAIVAFYRHVPGHDQVPSPRDGADSRSRRTEDA